jgi:hypothetical protein
VKVFIEARDGLLVSLDTVTAIDAHVTREDLTLLWRKGEEVATTIEMQRDELLRRLREMGAIGVVRPSREIR